MSIHCKPEGATVSSDVIFAYIGLLVCSVLAIALMFQAFIGLMFSLWGYFVLGHDLSWVWKPFLFSTVMVIAASLCLKIFMHCKIILEQKQ